MKKITPLLFLAVCVFLTVCTQPSLEDPKEIISRSVEKHGGETLCDWETMVINGEVFQEDVGKVYRGEYILYVQKPDKLREERDLTKFEHGRLFYSYIYNAGQGWVLTNLIPRYSKQYGKTFKRWLDRCDGITYYANEADTLIKKQEEKVNGKNTYVISAVIESDTTTLYIDKKDFYLIQDVYKNVKRLYSNFKEFGNTVYATDITEIQTFGERTSEVRFKYNTIEFDVPIDQSLFEEDMPKELSNN